MTWEEFGEMTPSMFQALHKRRHEDFKRLCYTAGIPASMVYNVNRGEDSNPISPFEFVPRRPLTARERVIHNIKSEFAMVKPGTPVEFLEKKRQRTIEHLIKAGHADAEQLFREAFPSWTIPPTS
jgi:hypothetical protein